MASFGLIKVRIHNNNSRTFDEITYRVPREKNKNALALFEEKGVDIKSGDSLLLVSYGIVDGVVCGRVTRSISKEPMCEINSDRNNQSKMASLKHIITTKANGSIPVHKYKSESTGLTVVIGEVEGPLVNGYFCLATEAHDDDGLPHTLEHLIFLGSELYPYKGVLDLLANRCLASGTNAWTDTDHTCYTIKTVGKDGFLELMPIYLDHILFPTLSDAGYHTEVHHISPDGEDSGVVYCEMQGRENSAESRAALETLRLLYPNCGYSAETGGILQNLRTSTSNEKVRNYHGQFYRPENLTLIITGQVGIEDVAKALKPVEDRILGKPKKPEFVRPWFTPVAPLAETVHKRIVYPSDCEDCGIVHVAWRGPNCTQENFKLTACSVLLRYLSETSVSPLQREMVEISDPFASVVSYNLIENSTSALYLLFENVPMTKIDLVYDKMVSVLTNIADGGEKLDMHRMQNILDRCILEYFSNLESNAHEALAFTAIADALYGEKNEDFEMRLNLSLQMRELLTKDEPFWIELLNEYLINAKRISVRAVPSVDEQKRMAKEEAERVECQRKALGVEGLAKKAEELAAAVAQNEIPPPPEMLTQVPIPDVSKINSLSSTIVQRDGDVFGDESKLHGLNLNKFPIPVNVTACSINSNFGYIIVFVNTSGVDDELRPYFTLYSELITESPIRKEDGTLMPYEEVVAALESDTVSLSTTLGLDARSAFSCGSYSQTAILMLKTEHKKYNRGIRWVTDLLNNTEFTVDRIRVCGAKIANAVSQAKRNGNSITHDLLRAIYFDKNSNVRKCSMIHQQRFLNALLEKLNDPAEATKIIADLNRIRDEHLKSNRLSLYVAGDWEKILKENPDYYSKWSKIIPNDGQTAFDKTKCEKPPVDYLLHKSIVSEGQALGLGCIEGAFLAHAAPCKLNINDPAYIPLMLFMQYLTQLEGPFWRQIRGQGLAYGYNMYVRLHERLLYFTLYRATNCANAFKQFKQITENQLSSDAVWDQALIESAKSSLIFSFVEREKSVDTLVLQNFISACFHDTKRITDINQDLIQRISKVTAEDMVSVGCQYISKLFTPEARTSIVCHPDKVNEICNDFQKFGFKLTVSTNIETSLLGQEDD